MSRKSADSNPLSEQETGTPMRPLSMRARASRAGLSETVAAAANLLEEGDRVHAGIPLDARDLLLEEIAPDPLQPRRRFDDGELQTLSEDIRRRGILQPILVRPPETPEGKYRLVAGERRWRAAALAGKVRIPARIRDMSDSEVQAAQMAENVLRTGLTDIEKGRALRRLYELRKVQHPKTTWEDIAAEVGLGRARIHDLFLLASLPEEIAGLIDAGRLSGSHGIALQRAQGVLDEALLVDLAQQAAREEARRDGGFRMSVSQLRARIQEQTQTDSTALPASEAPTLSPNLPVVRPFVRRLLAAVQNNSLTEEEQQLVKEAMKALGSVESGPIVNSN